MLKENGQWIEPEDEKELLKKELTEARGLLAELFRTEIFGEELMKNEATYLAHPAGARMCDFAFVTKKGGDEREFVGLDILARSETIGGIIRPEDVSYVEIERMMWADHELRPKLEAGKKILIVTRSDLEHWLGFYRQIEGSELYRKLGRKLLDYSGLGRTDEHFADRFEAATAELLMQERHAFGEREINVELPPRGKFDRAFMDARGQTKGMPIYHVRVGRLEGEILVEEILSEPVMAPGLVVRRTGENKREAYQRAANLASYWRRYFPWREGYEDLRVEVPVISAGQLSVWHKLGMWETLGSYLPDTGLSVEEVIRYLYLGKSNIDPGELALKGLSLPESGDEFRGVDLVFMIKTIVEETEKHQFIGVDNLAGLSPKNWPKWQKEVFEKEGEYMNEKFETIQTTNIGGIVIFPDEATKEEMGARVEKLEYDLAYRTWGPRQGLLYLTPRLFREWQQRGTVFETKEINYGNLKKRIEYGFGVSDLARIDLLIVREKAQIGGQREFVVEVGVNGDQVYYPLDAGATFDVPNAKKGVAKQPRRLEGVMPLLEAGWVPMIPGLVHSEYILGTVEGFPYLWQGGGGMTASYIRSELVHRGLSDELLAVLFNREKKRDVNLGLDDEKIEMIAKEKAMALWELGIKDEQDWYQGRQIEFGPAVISHPHADHDAMLAYYSSMEVITRGEAVGFMRAKSNWGTWRQNLVAVSDIRNYRQGRTYEKEYRKFTPIYWDNQKVRVSQHISVQTPRTNHSIPSTMTAYYHNNQPMFVQTHDFKPGPLTEKAVEMFEGVFPIIVTETTNTLDWTKPSTGITEDIVADTIQYLSRKMGKGNMMVVVCPPNNLERMNTIRKVMEEGGKRKVALGAKHAEVIEQLRAERRLAPRGSQGYDFVLPEIGEEVALFAGAKDPQTYEKGLRQKAAVGKLGIVDKETLGEEGQEWLVILSPYDDLEKEFEGVSFVRQGLLVLHSAYYAYDPQTAWGYAGNVSWVNNQDRKMQRYGQRAKYILDFDLSENGGYVGPGANYDRDDGKPYGLHASGHASFQEAFKVIHGLLGRNYKNKELVLVHGKHPYKYKNDWQDKYVQEFGEEMLRQLRLDRPGGLKITAKLSRYDPADPLNSSGFRIRLD